MTLIRTCAARYSSTGQPFATDTPFGTRWRLHVGFFDQHVKRVEGERGPRPYECETLSQVHKLKKALTQRD
jgi:hypothetical protein